MGKKAIQQSNGLYYQNPESSDCTLQLTFKKVPLTQSWCNIKEEHSQQSEETI